MANGKIGRKMGTRVGFVLASIAAYFVTLAVIVNYGTWVPHDPEVVKMMIAAELSLDPVIMLDQKMAWDALEMLLWVLMAAVAGDTARPSGMKAGAFGVSANESTA